MPIEIKITDITLLTLEQIDKLHSYLIDSHKPSNPSADLDTSELLDEARTEIKQDPFLSGLPITILLEARKKETKPKKKQKINTEFTPEEVAETSEFDCPTIESETPPPPYPDILKVTHVEDPEALYQDLIAYVLENTKTKKLHFDQTMAIVTRFGLINLNSLPQSPHLIPAVFAAFKELLECKT